MQTNKKNAYKREAKLEIKHLVNSWLYIPTRIRTWSGLFYELWNIVMDVIRFIGLVIFTILSPLLIILSLFNYSNKLKRWYNKNNHCVSKYDNWIAFPLVGDSRNEMIDDHYKSMIKLISNRCTSNRWPEKSDYLDEFLDKLEIAYKNELAK